MIPKINKQNRRNIILKNLRMFSCSSLICLCALLMLTTCSAEQQALCEWSSFHGPDRTNKSTGTGLLNEWPEEGPRLIWSAPGLGEGFSTVSFGGGFIYTAGVNENQSYVFCFDLNGKLIWKARTATYGQQECLMPVHIQDQEVPRHMTMDYYIILEIWAGWQLLTQSQARRYGIRI